MRLNEKEKHEKSNSHKNQRLWPAMVRQEQIHCVKLRYGVQRTDSGAEKERCPSRGIALMFYRPHRDVPCRKAPQVAYIVMFVTRWHKKSDAKIVFFVIG